LLLENWERNVEAYVLFHDPHHDFFSAARLGEEVKME
jgi:hypothetical protein